MEDTDTLYVSMKEKFFLSTDNFKVDQTVEPGQVLTIVADPIGSMVHSETKETTTSHYASPLAMTASRFRDFMYVGTSFSLVPAATNAQVDPAHVSDTGAGSSNYLNPIDMSGCIHYRRWLGGNFMYPNGKPTKVIPKPGSPEETITVYSQEDAMNLDVSWLNDPRFTHVSVTDGFSFDSVPMEAGVVTAAHATDSVFGYYRSNNTGAGGGSAVEYPYEQPLGITALRGAEVKRRLWGPNPFAGFLYEPITGSYAPEDPQFKVSMINRYFPWFSDVDQVVTPAGSTDAMLLDMLVRMTKQTYYNPLCILRLPDAYGSRFFWTGYMRHYFAFRHPYLLDGTWTAGKIEANITDSADLSQRIPMANGTVQIVPRKVKPKTLVGVFHAEPTDPYAYDNEIQKLTMSDEDAGLIAEFRDKLANASVTDVLDYMRGYEKGKKDSLDPRKADIDKPANTPGPVV